MIRPRMIRPRMIRPRRVGRVVPTIAAIAVGATVLAGCGFNGLYSAPLPGGADLGNHPYTFTAHFADVLDLVPQSAVKVNDVAVGKVTAISLDGWTAKVTMEVRGSVHLPANARAEVAQTSLLGEKYVALEQPLSAPSTQLLHNHSDIPLSDTTSAAEVEQVLGALSLLLNEGGLSQIQVIARELNAALDGNSGAVRSLINELNTFVGTLNSQRDKITTALTNLNTLAATLNRQKGIIITALDTYPAALKVLSDERGKLVGLLTSLSHLGTVATGVINGTQSNLVAALKSLDEPVKQLTASGNNLSGALRIIGTFPFPLGTSREFVKGDYANLSASINLNLTAELCGVLGSKFPALCAIGSTVGGAAGSSASSTATTAGGAASSSAAGSTQLAQPQIIGSAVSK